MINPFSKKLTCVSKYRVSDSANSARRQNATAYEWIHPLGTTRFAAFWVNRYGFARNFRFESLIATTPLHEAGEELPPGPPDTED
jgi:hypothetical protein